MSRSRGGALGRLPSQIAPYVFFSCAAFCIKQKCSTSSLAWFKQLFLTSTWSSNLTAHDLRSTAGLQKHEHCTSKCPVLAAKLQSSNLMPVQSLMPCTRCTLRVHKLAATPDHQPFASKQMVLIPVVEHNAAVCACCCVPQTVPGTKMRSSHEAIDT